MNNELRNKLPNLFIVGAAKAGTTTLYDTLSQHPDVFFPFDKEPAFFCDDEYYARGKEWYLDTFYKRSGIRKVRGDATPRYLYWGRKVVPRLQSLYGNELPKIISIFRDPMALVHSFYWHSVREGRENLGLKEALALEEERIKENNDYLSRRGRITYCYHRIGLYATQLEPYLESFPKRNMLFLLTEDLQDFGQLTRRLEGFLELEHSDRMKPAVSNPAALPRSRELHRWLRTTSGIKQFMKKLLPLGLRHRLKNVAIEMNLRSFQTPTLDTEISAYLREHYRDEVTRLQDIIGRDLSAWL